MPIPTPLCVMVTVHACRQCSPLRGSAGASPPWQCISFWGSGFRRAEGGGLIHGIAFAVPPVMSATLVVLASGTSRHVDHLDFPQCGTCLSGLMYWVFFFWLWSNLLHPVRIAIAFHATMCFAVRFRCLWDCMLTCFFHFATIPVHAVVVCGNDTCISHGCLQPCCRFPIFVLVAINVHSCGLLAV